MYNNKIKMVSKIVISWNSELLEYKQIMWHYNILKKYNSTSHLRLIKQLKSELKVSKKHANKYKQDSKENK